MELAQRHNFLAVLSVQDLAHSAVDSGQAAEDALEASDHGDGVVTGEVTQSQQHEQDGEAAEDNLGSLIVLQSADEHECGEDAPQQQIVAHSHLACAFDALKGIDPDQDQGPPEQAVSGECGAGEGVTLAQLTDTGNDLSQAAQSDAHSHDHDGQGDQVCVMQVQQNSGHTEAQQAQRAGICNFSHTIFLQIIIYFYTTGIIIRDIQPKGKDYIPSFGLNFTITGFLTFSLTALVNS